MGEETNLIGKQFGSYRLTALLNKGAFGSVYQGVHTVFQDDPTIAVKILHAHFDTSEEHEAFLREAQFLKKLAHPHILPVITAGIEDGIPYIVTEYAASGSLRDRLRQSAGQPLPLGEAMSILTHIGQALHYAHTQHIVHRDLKPANVLFNERGDALLADFGIATMLSTIGTQQLGQAGTPTYMAPEQFEGLVSPKSDQYALACIAYELVTGRKLFAPPHPSLEILWYYHAKVEPPAPTSFNSSLPAFMEHALLKALAKERTYRHTDVAAFLTALSQPPSSESVTTTPVNDQERHEERLAMYEEALRINPSNALAQRDKGMTLLCLHRYEEALAVFEEAIGMDPDASLAHNGKGCALCALGRYDEALMAYEQSIYLNPSAADFYTNKGQVLNALQRWKEALVVLEQALRLKPHDSNALDAKMIALWNLDRAEEALLTIEQALEQEPNQTKFLLAKGKSLKDLQRNEEALETFTQVLSLDSSRAAEAYTGQGFALFSLKRYTEALQAAEQAIQLHPDGASAYHCKSNALYRLGHTTEALAAAEKALQLNSKEAGAHNAKGNALLTLGRSTEALESYEIACTLDPRNPDFYSNKGQVLLTLSRYVEALAASEQILRLTPNDWRAYEIKGKALSALERDREAITAYDQLLSLGPKKLDRAGIHCRKAEAWERLGCYEEMLGEAEQALGLTPQNLEAYHMKAEALYGLRRYEEELEAYDLILNMAPDAKVYCQKGMLLLKLNRYEEAIKSTDEALRISLHNARAYDIKGIALCELERYEEAVAAYEQILLWSPHEARIVKNKDTIQRYLGKMKWYRLLGRPLAKPRISPPVEGKSTAKQVSQAIRAYTYQCSFCGKPQEQVERLIAGPEGKGKICNECVNLCGEMLHEEGIYLSESRRAQLQEPMKQGNASPDERYRCSFCGKPRQQIQRLIGGLGAVYICDECTSLCVEILQEEREMIRRSSQEK